MEIMKQVRGGKESFVAKVTQRLRHDQLLYDLACLGAGALAVSMPAIAPVAIFVGLLQKKNKRYAKKQLRNSFYYFKKQGLLSVESRKGQTCLMISTEGERRARLFASAKTLKEKLRPGKRPSWDRKWRVALFDIKNTNTLARDALRHLLKRCGFVLLQKSAWVYPFDCREELGFLGSFFRLSEQELRVVVSPDIGDDSHLRKIFSL